MVSALLGRIFGIRLARDPITKDRLLPLELSRLVLGVNPVQDILCITLGLDEAEISGVLQWHHFQSTYRHCSEAGKLKMMGIDEP